MQWLDSIDITTIDNANIEDYTGIPFIKTNDNYEWGIEYVTFNSPRELQSLIMTFELKYQGRMLPGTFQEYGTQKGFHSFQAIHKLLTIHLYTHLHPLFILNHPFTIRYISIFSTNREILQLFLKGLRVCASIKAENEHNYIDSGIDETE